MPENTCIKYPHILKFFLVVGLLFGLLNGVSARSLNAIAGESVQLASKGSNATVLFISSSVEGYSFLSDHVDYHNDGSCFFKVPDDTGNYHFRLIKANRDEEVLDVVARKQLWWLFMIIGLIGGLGMFLYGMEMMSDGLQKSAGDRMRAVLGKLTHNSLVGVGVGAFVTALIQSSGAAAVMLVSFVNSKLMKFRQTLPVILGAAIGTTITAQLIAFKLTDYALLFVGVGVVLNLFISKQSLKNAGETILGFGLLFYGMYVMSSAMVPLRSYEPFLNILLNLENPLLGILAGALFTAVLQSSSAFIGIMIIFASQGFLTLESSLPLLLGANMGTPMPALLSSLKTSVEAKKVAFAQLFYKVVLVLLFFWWLPTIQTWLELFSANQGQEAELSRQIANGHTFFNLIVTFAALPFIGYTDKLISWFFRSSEESERKSKPTVRLRYLDLSVVAAPSLAINLAKEETSRLSRKVYESVEEIMLPFMENDLEYVHDLSDKRNEIKLIRDEIKNYLFAIHRKSGNKQRLDETYQLMHTLNELSHINDAVTKVLLRRAEKWIKRDYKFSDMQRKEIFSYHQRTLQLLRTTFDLFKEFNLKKAQKLDKRYEKLSDDADRLARFHYDRLFNDVNVEVENSKTHLELVSTFQMIALHARNISNIFSNQGEAD